VVTTLKTYFLSSILVYSSHFVIYLQSGRFPVDLFPHQISICVSCRSIQTVWLIVASLTTLPLQEPSWQHNITTLTTGLLAT